MRMLSAAGVDLHLSLESHLHDRRLMITRLAFPTIKAVPIFMLMLMYIRAGPSCASFARRCALFQPMFRP